MTPAEVDSGESSSEYEISGLQTQILLGGTPLDNEAEVRRKLGEIAEYPESLNFTRIINASNVERQLFWQREEFQGLSKGEKEDLWINQVTNFIQTRPPEEQEFLRKLGIDPANGADYLYQTYFSGGKSNVNNFITDIVTNIQVNSQEIEQHQELIRKISGIFGNHSAQAIQQAILGIEKVTSILGPGGQIDPLVLESLIRSAQSPKSPLLQGLDTLANQWHPNNESPRTATENQARPQATHQAEHPAQARQNEEDEEADLLPAHDPDVELDDWEEPEKPNTESLQSIYENYWDFCDSLKTDHERTVLQNFFEEAVAQYLPPNTKVPPISDVINYLETSHNDLPVLVGKATPRYDMEYFTRHMNNWFHNYPDAKDLAFVVAELYHYDQYLRSQEYIEEVNGKALPELQEDEDHEDVDLVDEINNALKNLADKNQSDVDFEITPKLLSDFVKTLPLVKDFKVKIFRNVLSKKPNIFITGNIGNRTNGVRIEQLILDNDDRGGFKTFSKISRAYGLYKHRSQEWEKEYSNLRRLLRDYADPEIEGYKVSSLSLVDGKLMLKVTKKIPAPDELNVQMPSPPEPREEHLYSINDLPPAPQPEKSPPSSPLHPLNTTPIESTSAEEPSEPQPHIPFWAHQRPTTTSAPEQVPSNQPDNQEERPKSADEVIEEFRKALDELLDHPDKMERFKKNYSREFSYFTDNLPNKEVPDAETAILEIVNAYHSLSDEKAKDELKTDLNYYFKKFQSEPSVFDLAYAIAQSYYRSQLKKQSQLLVESHIPTEPHDSSGNIDIPTFLRNHDLNDSEPVISHHPVDEETYHFTDPKDLKDQINTALETSTKPINNFVVTPEVLSEFAKSFNPDLKSMDIKIEPNPNGTSLIIINAKGSRGILGGVEIHDLVIKDDHGIFTAMNKDDAIKYIRGGNLMKGSIDQAFENLNQTIKDRLNEHLLKDYESDGLIIEDGKLTLRVKKTSTH